MNYLWFVLSFSISVFAKPSERTLYYQVEKGDTFGTVIFSLGYLKLWTGSAHVNRFKNRASDKNVNHVGIGDKISINESDIVFKKNIKIQGQRLFFIKKVTRIRDWKKLMANEGSPQVAQSPRQIVVEKNGETRVYNKSNSSMNLYLGAGGFLNRDSEVDRSTKTTTQTGIQPFGQFKGIYSHPSIGSVAVDILAKKIINSEFSFPINTDARFQVLPKWFGFGPMNFALSYSRLKHSYVGKPQNTVEAYELSASFIGLGVVWPKGSYWYEVYLEKAISSNTRSMTQNIELNEGWRIDSELIYPIGKGWRIIPGLNYYMTKSSSKDYQMSVLELRSAVAWEF